MLLTAVPHEQQSQIVRPELEVGPANARPNLAGANAYLRTGTTRNRPCIAVHSEPLVDNLLAGNHSLPPGDCCQDILERCFLASQTAGRIHARC